MQLVVPLTMPRPRVTRSPDGDARELERCTDPLRQVVTVLVQQTHDLAAHDAAAEQRDLQRLRGHSTSSASRSSIDSRRSSTLDLPARTATTGGRGITL